MTCCKPNWIFAQKFPFRLQQAYKVLKWVRISVDLWRPSWNVSIKMKRMQKTLFFGLAAKVLSDLFCNRPNVTYINVTKKKMYRIALQLAFISAAFHPYLLLRKISVQYETVHYVIRCSQWMEEFSSPSRNTAFHSSYKSGKSKVYNT